MTEFVLKNNTFEIDGKIKQQVAGRAIATNLLPLMHAFIWMSYRLNF